MQTDAINGTASNALITNAIGTYLAAKGISTANYTLTSYASPTIATLATINTNQTVVDLVCGYYNTSNARTGGHCVALVNQSINVQGQSSPSTLAINNPLPGAFAPLQDTPSDSLEYLNTVPTTSGVTADGALQLDSAQYPGFWGSTRLVVETAIALTVNASQQSVNAPAISTWTLTSTRSMNLNGGDLTVLAPISGAGSISITQPGTLELEAADTTTGANVVNGSTLKSDVASGTPFGTGSIQLQAGTLQLSPASGTAAASFTIASAANRQLTFAGASSILLDRNSHSSLALTIGGYTDGVTPNFSRAGAGTILIAPADGTAALGSLDLVSVAGTAANLPAVTNGIVSPFSVAQDNDASASGDFLNYTAGGFVPATYISSNTTGIAVAGSSAVYSANINILFTAGASASVYALKVGPHIITGSSSTTLSIGPQTSGQAGLILNGGTIGVTTLNFGPAEGLVYSSLANGTISSVIQGSGGLTTFGPGALALQGANAYSGSTTVQSGTLIAANSSGSATGTSSITVLQNATLKISGASALAGADAGTTINTYANLLLNGGTLAGPLTLQPGAFLQGQGTISGAATLNGTIGGSATSQNIHFTGNVTMSNTTIYDWRLNALDATPANAGINWSLLTMTGPSITLGSSGSVMNFTIDLPPSLPDPNSGNIFWDQSHQWLAITSTSSSWGVRYNWDFPAFLQGYFTRPSSISTPQINIMYVPYAATTTNWNSTTGGSWSLTSNWSGNTLAHHVGDTANFTTSFSAPAYVTLDNEWTLGIINFKSANALVITPGQNNGSLTLNNGASAAAINNLGGVFFLYAPLTLFSNTTLLTTNSTDTISFLSPVSGAGGFAISGPGNVTLAAANSYLGNTTITSGTLLINDPNALPITTALSIGNLTTTALVKLAAGIGASKIAALSIAGSSHLDLTSDPLIVEPLPANKSSSLASLRTLLTSHAITSSTLPANFGIALLDNAVLNKSTFSGQPTDTTSLILAPELLGDANADGHVDLSDLSTVLNNFGATTANWTSGNFDYQPTIDLTDLSDVLNNFGQSNSNASTSSLILQPSASPSPAPEPTSIPLFALVIPLLARRRRQTAHCGTQWK